MIMSQINKFNEINNYIFDKSNQPLTLKDEELKVESTRMIARAALKTILDKETLEEIALFAGFEDKQSEKALLEKAKMIAMEDQKVIEGNMAIR